MRTGLHESAVESVEQVHPGARRRVAELGARHPVDELGGVCPTLPELSYSTCTLGEATMSAASSDEMYTRMRALHRDACAAGQYQVSYYLLSAMMHLASEMGDEARLLDIAREASERRARLEVHEPNHPLATRPGHPGAFEVLASIAMARVERAQTTHPGPNRENGQ